MLIPGGVYGGPREPLAAFLGPPEGCLRFSCARQLFGSYGLEARIAQYIQAIVLAAEACAIAMGRRRLCDSTGDSTGH